jgi:ribosomal protein S27E
LIYRYLQKIKKPKGKKMKKEKDIAMQSRCIYCKKEQYAMVVFDISHGEHPCVWCGKTPPVLTEAEYRKLLKTENGKEGTI